MRKKDRAYHFIVCFFCIVYAHSITAGFVAGTYIKRLNDYIPIEQAQVNDKVICYDFKNSEVEKAITCVTKKHVNKYKRIIIGDQSINVSFDQKFYLPYEQQWIEAQNLIQGHILLRGNSECCSIDAVLEIDEQIDVYDITVAEYHNFYVLPYDVVAHNFVVEIAIGASWAIGGGTVEFAGFSFAASAFGLMLGIFLACKKEKSESDNNYSITPIVNYQPSYSDESIDLISVMNSPNVCRDTTLKSSLVTKPDSKNLILRKKNNNKKKEKNKRGNNNNNNGDGDGKPPDDGNNLNGRNNEDENKERVINKITKTAFFKKLKDQYEHWRDGIYKKKPHVKGIENAEYLQWDYTHNDVEAYGANKKHLGSINPQTERFCKPAVPNRQLTKR